MFCIYDRTILQGFIYVSNLRLTLHVRFVSFEHISSLCPVIWEILLVSVMTAMTLGSRN